MILKIRNLSHDYTGMIPLNRSHYKKENTYTKLPSLLQDSAGLPIEETLVVVPLFLFVTHWHDAVLSPVSLSLWMSRSCADHMLPGPLPGVDCPVLPRTGPGGGTRPGTDIAHRQPGLTAPVALVGWSRPSISHKHCPHVTWKFNWKICSSILNSHFLLNLPSCWL